MSVTRKKRRICWVVVFFLSQRRKAPVAGCSRLRSGPSLRSPPWGPGHSLLPSAGGLSPILSNLRGMRAKAEQQLCILGHDMGSLEAPRASGVSTEGVPLKIAHRLYLLAPSPLTSLPRCSALRASDGATCPVHKSQRFRQHTPQAPSKPKKFVECSGDPSKEANKTNAKANRSPMHGSIVDLPEQDPRPAAPLFFSCQQNDVRDPLLRKHVSSWCRPRCDSFSCPGHSHGYRTHSHEGQT